MRLADWSNRSFNDPREFRQWSLTRPVSAREAQISTGIAD
jgi:hypothetical protein